MDLKEYIKMLEQHDWFYSMSHDSRVYERGLESERKLKKLAEDKESFKEAYNDMYKRYFPK